MTSLRIKAWMNEIFLRICMAFFFSLGRWRELVGLSRRGIACLYRVLEGQRQSNSFRALTIPTLVSRPKLNDDAESQPWFGADVAPKTRNPLGTFDRSAVSFNRPNSDQYESWNADTFYTRNLAIDLEISRLELIYYAYIHGLIYFFIIALWARAKAHSNLSLLYGTFSVTPTTLAHTVDYR